ncbi:MAG: Bro-N domain-containing protein, partial [Methylocella sp.]
MKAEESQTEGAQIGSLPVVFTFENQAIRTIAKNDETWFVAADVCKALEIQDTSDAIERIEEDEKGKELIPTLGGLQKLLTVNEYGLYTLIIRSDKPKAREFRRWITHDVLPSIRKTGRYEARQQDQPQIEEIQV